VSASSGGTTFPDSAIKSNSEISSSSVSGLRLAGFGFSTGLVGSSSDPFPRSNSSFILQPSAF
jgi:hypothetical protein